MLFQIVNTSTNEHPFVDIEKSKKNKIYIIEKKLFDSGILHVILTNDIG